MPRTSVSQSYKPLVGIFNRPVIGLDRVVRHSFQTHRSDDPSVGVIGWSFHQKGLDYVFIYRESADLKKKYDFTVAAHVPSNQPYLHPSDNIGLAEKAHIAAVIQHLLDPFAKRQAIPMFFEYEQACSAGNGVSVLVDRDDNAQLSPLNNSETRIYYRISFPDDGNYLAVPAEEIARIEWIKNGRHNGVDFSRGFATFHTEELGKPFTRTLMTRLEAVDAIRRIAEVSQGDPTLQPIALKMGLFRLMVDAINLLPQGQRPALSGP